jgi:glycosyltransferase involved in cell wall biosynthesis
MKVLHVIPSVGPLRGGPSSNMRTLSRGLSRQGISVDVACTDDNGKARLDVPLNTPVPQDGATYRYFPRQTGFYTCSWPLSAWLWKHAGDYDVIHIHALFSYSSTAAAIASSMKQRPYIVRPLGILNRWGMKNRRPLFKRLSFHACEKRILRRAFAVHFTSELERMEAEELRVDCRSAVIPNPVELPNSPPFRKGRFRARHPGSQDKLIYLFLSRIDEKKGLDLLLNAFALVHREASDCVLVVAGDGPPALVASLRDQAVRLGIETAVVWAGFLQGDAKQEALADADVFVLPSYSENFGISVVEAMGARVPVIISDQVGIYPDIARAKAGMVTPCSVEPLVEAMTALGRDPGLRLETACRGYQLAHQEFSVESVCRKVADLYESAAGASVRPS